MDQDKKGKSEAVNPDLILEEQKEREKAMLDHAHWLAYLLLGVGSVAFGAGKIQGNAEARRGIADAQGLKRSAGK